MGDFRISYGRALGKLNNFFARTDGLATQADTTPDVTDIGLLYTNNTTTTVITYFDLRTPQGNNLQPGWFEGKELRVIFLDDSTSLARTSQMVISGTDGAQGANNVVDLLFHNSAWIETGRSLNSNTIVNATSASLGATGIVNAVGGVNVIRLNGTTGSNNILRRAINGAQGQILTIVANSVSDSLVIVNSAAADTFVSTTSGSSATQFRLMSSGAISFIRNNTKWLEIRPVWSNSSVGIAQ